MLDHQLAGWLGDALSDVSLFDGLWVDDLDRIWYQKHAYWITFFFLARALMSILAIFVDSPFRDVRLCCLE